MTPRPKVGDIIAGSSQPLTLKREGLASGISDELVRELRGVVARPLREEAEPQPEPEPQPELLTPVAPLPRRHPLDAFTPIQAQSSTSRTIFSRGRLTDLLSLAPWFVGAGLVIAGLLYVSQYGLHMKGRVVQQGNAAIAHMLAAKADVERLDWQSAQADFDHAGQMFSDAGGQLGILTGLLSKLPGLHALKAGHDLTTAGRVMSEAGSSISEALVALGRAGESSPAAKDLVLTDALNKLDHALTDAAGKVKQATELLNGIDVAEIPADSREQFTSFRDRLPAIKDLIDRGVSTVAFTRGFMGEDRPRRYLVLFQNSSELRPTGGFPGSYGLLTTEGGRVKDWRADDIYNPDGQIKDLIVPPIQLQHITPGWGMRDANWFADFAASAQKVMELWRRGGGEAVDGVLAIRPEVLASLLEVTGPVSLPAYDIVLTSDNVISALQTEVEENRPSGKPKQIISDLAPLVLDRLATLPAAQWPLLLNAVSGALDRRDVLMYFAEPKMEEFADRQQWSGRIGDHPGDYLMVNIANVAGAKADAVTDTALKLESRMEGGTLVHRLTIKRRHDGGATPFGFYNKVNKSYVRVLVPKGSTLRGITGNDQPHNKPLMSYANVSAVRDPDLERLEATYQYDAARDTTTSEESGKTGFGFWMKVEPGETDEVQLEYVVPAAAAAQNYSLYVQRQPGLDISDFELTLDKPALMVSESSPEMVEWPDSWRLHSNLKQDLNLEATLR